MYLVIQGVSKIDLDIQGFNYFLQIPGSYADLDMISKGFPKYFRWISGVSKIDLVIQGVSILKIRTSSTWGVRPISGKALKKYVAFKWNLFNVFLYYLLISLCCFYEKVNILRSKFHSLVHTCIIFLQNTVINPKISNKKIYILIITRFSFILLRFFLFFAQENTKERVVQSLIINDILIKRKTSYDHLREGLKSNEVLSVLEINPDVSKDLLVYCESLDGVTPENLLNEVVFSVATSSQKKMFKDAIHLCTKKQLRNLIKFVSGCQDLRALKTKNLTVIFRSVDGVFASSCLFELYLPDSCTNAKDLKTVLISANGSQFNVV